ncbi:MAG: outer membrane beta-barrel protein [Pseudomonadota bacterium]
MTKFLAIAVVASGTTFATTQASFAEATISVFGGANFSPHSDIDFSVDGGNSGSDIAIDWDGESFEAPPYYGVRATYWFETMPEFGVALEFTHAKVAADPLPAGISTLEFTDGINFLTLNGLYRKEFDNGLTPYGGLGIGLSIPNVEFEEASSPVETDEYQVTGVALQGFVGLDYSITERWSVFGEYKFSYGQVDADLEGGGSLDTDIISNQFIFGVTFKVF